MSEASANQAGPERHPVTRKRLVVPIANVDGIAVRKGIPVPARSGLALDLYRPPTGDSDLVGAVIFVTGVPDAGARRILGCAVNEMAAFSSWASAAAAAGMMGVTFTTTDDPALDLQAVVTHLQTQGESLGIDGRRCALWACSAHVPCGLGLLLSMPDAVRCAVFCYGFMLDLDDSHAVADAQRTLGFANPAQGCRVDELPPTPLLVARAGQDAVAGVNVSIDRFVRHALAHNLPLTLINHHSGPHAFDLDDDAAATRRIVTEILSFLRSHVA
jgi:hypothetical protein